MAIDVSASILIGAPRATVAQYATEPLNDPRWIGGISHAEVLTKRPLGPGTQIRRLASFMGKTIDYILEVVEFDENALLLMKSVKGPFPIIVSYQFDHHDSGTFMRIRVQGDSTGFYSLTDFLMAPRVRRPIQGDLERLKQVLEGATHQPVA